MARWLLVAALVLTFRATPAWSASVPLSPAAGSLAIPATFPDLRPGSRVRVGFARGGRLDGRFGRYTMEALVLAGPDTSRGIPLAEIATLHVRGTAWRTGMLTGAVAGGVSTALLTSLVCVVIQAADDSAGNDGRWVGCALVGGVGGALGGGLLGAGIGSLIPKWHRRYPP